MQNVHALVTVVIACGAGTVMLAPAATADPGAFLDELRTNDVWLPGRNADEVMNAGYGACADLRTGVSVLDEMSRVEHVYQFQQGTLFVSAATTHLCPDFAG